MKTYIIFYSFSGNNRKLAEGLAQSLNIGYSEIREREKRTILTIFLDVVFNRIPQTFETDQQINHYEHLIIISPIWFGKVASPLRAFFKECKGKIKNYTFVSLSAGANGKNTGIRKDLEKRTGFLPKTVINPLISEILPSNLKSSRKELDAYRLSTSDAKNIVKKIVYELDLGNNIK